ncbi:MAG: response regulator [Bacteroidales bacterium]|nr:response regulator [Bacteroidales bacterium]MBN2758589.1 response regulator [Bacteroidales bacterium]
MEKKKFSIKKNISLRIILFIIIAAIVFSAVVGFIQAINGYQNLKIQKTNRLEFIKAIYANPIAKNAFDLDINKLDLITDGILNNKEISYIKISEHSKKNINKHQILIEKGKKGNLKLTFSVNYNKFTKNNAEFINIELNSNILALKNYLINFIWRYILNNGIITLLLSSFIYFILYSFIIKHIIKTSSFFNEFNLNNPKKTLAYNRNKFFTSKKDEIGQLESAINQMRNKILEFKEERLKAENQLKQNNLDLEQAKEKAEESNQLKTAFLNNISHEFRTPMNGIIGFSELLIKNDKTKNQKETYVEIIKESCGKLINIVNDTVEISKIQNKFIQISNDYVDLNQIINELSNFIKSKIKNKDIKFIIENNCSKHNLQIYTDRNKFYSILKHLADNAIKFTSYGFVKIKCEKINDEIKITIIDSGIGIAEEMQTKIFDAFSQVELGTTRNYGGSGIGLALVKSYIELIEGKIILKSELNAGTEVSIFISTKNSKIKTSETERKTDSLDNWSNKIILIVDDEEINFLYLAEILKLNDAKTLYAKNGKEAIDFCRNKTKIDIILMDIKMPILDGFEATKLIKEFRCEIPIIAQTAYHSDKEIEKIKLSRFDDYITKPINPTKLRTIVNKHMTLINC